MSGAVWLVGGDAALSVPPDRVTVWLVSLDDPAARARAAHVPLTAADHTAMAPHRDAGERLVRRRLAKLLLGEAAGVSPATVVIARSPAGAPRIVAPSGWHISVAARWPDCVIAVATVKVGVDMERVSEDAMPLDLLTERERHDLGSLGSGNRAAAFAMAWASKEAHAKWTGTPRALDPATVETSDPAWVTSPLGSSRCWRRRDGALAIALCTV